MAEFVFNTREEFKHHVKLCGNEPRNYKILEEEPKTQDLTIQEKPNTQNLKIQNPTTPEEAQPPTPTEKEAIKILTDFLNNTELIEDETYKTINNVIHPQTHDDAEILTDTEEEAQETIHSFIFNNEEDLKRHEAIVKEHTEQPEEDNNSTNNSDNNTDNNTTQDDNTEEEHTQEDTEEIDSIHTPLETTNDITSNKKLTPKDILDNVKYETTKLMEHLILENTYNNNLCSDVGNINLVKYYTDKDKKLTPITTPFLDSITMFKLFAPHEMAGDYIKENIISHWNIHVRDLCISNNIKVVPHSVKFKKPLRLRNTSAQVEAQTRAAFLEIIKQQPQIKDIFLQHHNLHGDIFKDCYIGVIKLELADEDFYTIEPQLNKLEQDLKHYNNQIYIKDTDITLDYAGTFNRDEIETHLIDNHEFNKKRRNT